ncbi:hypothetical protein PoB_003684800 [Plakobranchus ocellatus]|uniref:Uncharacterized protein n=1 Tax=Plakobranchus ocellatus TaxID=259542 RepID=A0AAV4ASJ1_9GAST|nr:hypothetical protein PoB_003684800 [Plakobranchus ocellatus]
MIIYCVESEGITMSGLNAVFLITSGCRSHSARSAETTQSSQPRRADLFYGCLLGSTLRATVANTVELVEEGWISPLAVLMIEASS